MEKDTISESKSPEFPPGYGRPTSVSSSTGKGSEVHNNLDRISQESDLPPVMDEKDVGIPNHSLSEDPEYDPPIVIPRLKRRGLFGQFTLLAEVDNPKAYSRKKKWFITFIVAVAAITAPMGSSIFFRKLTLPGPSTHAYLVSYV